MDHRQRLHKDPVPQEVGADKRLNLGKATAPAEPRVQKLVDHVVEHGYVVIPHAFSAADIEEARAEVKRLTAAPEAAGPAAAKGRNSFEGLRTQRLYGLVDKSRAFDKFALHADVLALNDHFLDPGYLLNSFQSINILAGEKAQTLHYDDGFVTVPRPHHPFGTAIMVAFDGYTPTNGATVIVPGSHSWGHDRVPDRSEAVPVIMPSGSIVFFLSTLWHGGGDNASSESRLALTVQYSQPWVRQIENQLLSVAWEKLDEIPPRLVDMLAFKVGSPFIGHVNGGSPRAAVARLLEKWKRQKGGASDAKL